jgi:hypothetical protein
MANLAKLGIDFFPLGLWIGGAHLRRDFIRDLSRDVLEVVLRKVRHLN